MPDPLPLMSDAERSRFQVDGERGFGSLQTAQGNLPLKRLQVAARIDGLVSILKVEQTFVNALATREPLEATYIFPLPDRAAVTRFEMRIGERLIEGVLRERAEARREDETALEQGHRAALAEEDRSGVFTMSVGNILPGESATVSLELTGPLQYDDGEVTLQFPLVVAPRYIPGGPLSGASVGDGAAVDTDAVPDASRITPPVLLPGFPSPVEFGLSVEIHQGGLPLRNLTSSLHSIVETESDSGVRRIVVQPGERLNRDFILRYAVAERAICTALQSAPDADAEGGTYQVTVLPPADLAAQRRPRDIVFILDRSGSMSGWKMVAARRALARMIDTLNDADRFSLLAFDTVVETLPGVATRQLVSATDRQRFSAIEFLARLEARGGTEIAEPLATALAAVGTSDNAERDRIIVLLTDGQVGNEDQILREHGQKLAGVRVFTLGIDRAVNMGFLRKLAMLGGGHTEVVESEERLDEVLAKIHRRIATPVLTDLRVQLAGAKIESGSETPRRLPALFPGVPLVVRGRYQGTAPASVVIQGADSVARPWTATVAMTDEPAPGIRTLWAREQVRALEDDYAVAPRGHEPLAKRIVETSLRFDVLSRFTAFVAVDRSETVNAGGERRRIVQPVELPDGWDARFMAGGSAQEVALSCSAPLGRGLMREIELGFPTSQSRGRARMARRENLDDVDTEVYVDLAGYRRRVHQLLSDLQHALPQAGTEMVLLHLLPELEALIEDLISIGALETVLNPLKAFLEVLQDAFVSGLKPERAEELWTQAEQLLAAFAAEQTPPAVDSKPAARRKSFWT